MGQRLPVSIWCGVATGVTALTIGWLLTPADAGDRAGSVSARPGSGTSRDGAAMAWAAQRPTPEWSGSASPAASTAGPVRPARTAASWAPGGVLFDDFVYPNTADRAFLGRWSVRTGSGAPGQTSALWAAGGVGFTGTGSATSMALTASTDGTPAGTRQAEVDSVAARYLLGTYAARVRFDGTPTGGPGGARVNQSFFTISGGSGANYSELDVEYLPAGGWGDNRTQLDLTSWATPQDSRSTASPRGYDGWHALVIQAASGTVSYYVDGARLFTSTGRYAARTAMSICFNTWFIDGELGAAGARRDYRQQVDWVYFAANRTLTPVAVQAQVDAARAAGVTATNSVS